MNDVYKGQGEDEGFASPAPLSASYNAADNTGAERLVAYWCSNDYTCLRDYN